MADAPIIALHGLGGDHRQFDGLLPPAKTVCCPDLRAHGGSTLSAAPDLLSIAQLAADVRTAYGGLDAPVLVGISMGAAIALELVASGFSARRMVLVRPAWRWAPSSDNLAIYTEIADALEQGRSAEQFAAGDGYRAVSAVSPAAAQALLAQFHQPWAAARSARLRRLPASAPLRPASVPPTLVLGCAGDPVHPLSLASAVAADIGARFGEIAPRYDRPREHKDALAVTLARFTSEV